MNISTLAIYHWHDAIEIIFFSSLFYGFARWLKHDTTKNLLPYFYGTCLLTLTAYTLNLSTILSCIFIFSPALIAVFILLHQETLQRNIVALKNITPAHKDTYNHDWQHTIIKTALLRLNDNKEIRCVIACSDDITPFVSTPFALRTPTTQSTINLLLTSPSFDTTQMLWCDTNGQLRGINTQWNMQEKNISGVQSINELWIEYSQLFTKKTDAFCFRLDPETRLFTVIKRGALIQGINAQELQRLLRVHVGNDKGYGIKRHNQKVIEK